VAKEFELKPGEVQIYVTEKEVRGNYSYYEACLKDPRKIRLCIGSTGERERRRLGRLTVEYYPLCSILNTMSSLREKRESQSL